MIWTPTLTWMPWTERPECCRYAAVETFSMRWLLQGVSASTHHHQDILCIASPDYSTISVQITQGCILSEYAAECLAEGL